MRKRKSPYILVSVLVVLLSLVLYVNGGLEKVIRDDVPHQAEATPPTTGESRGTATTQSLANATKSVASGVDASAAPKKSHLPDEAPPSIEIPAAIPQMPAPNETVPGSQWYRAPAPAKKGK